jgi:hypothetical protein
MVYFGMQQNPHNILSNLFIYFFLIIKSPKEKTPAESRRLEIPWLLGYNKNCILSI